MLRLRSRMGIMRLEQSRLCDAAKDPCFVCRALMCVARLCNDNLP